MTVSIDLTKLPKPQAVEELSYEEILAQRIAETKQRFAAAEIMSDWDSTLESDATLIQLQEASYREMGIRRRINDSIAACMLALSTWTDLDNLAANTNTQRQVVTPADDTTTPPTPAVMEKDSRLKVRAQLAWEGLSTAGPDGAYKKCVLDASPRVADVDVDSPSPVDVVLTILSTDNDGIADAALLATVTNALPGSGGKAKRPLTDRVTVQAATAKSYAINATLEFYDGPDVNLVLSTAQSQITDFVAGQRRLGEVVTKDGIHAALRVAGVKKITLTDFVEIICGPTEFPRCTAINVHRLVEA